MNEIFVYFPFWPCQNKSILHILLWLTLYVCTHTVVVNNSSRSVDRDFPYCKVDKCMQSCSFLFWRLCSWRKPGAPSMFCSPRSKYGKSVPKWEYIDFHFLYLTVFHRFITAPASSITFQQERLPTGQQVNVSCSAKNIYPQPQIKLTKGHL